MSELPEDRMIRSYLLGEMTVEERSAFQHQIFQDDDLFGRICEAEIDLADCLARGTLSPADAASVRKFLAETSQQDRLPFAQALAQVERRRETRSWHWVLPLAACVILGVTALLLGIRSHTLETRLAQTAHVPAPMGPVLVAAISPGALRGAATHLTVTLPAAATILELRLQVRSPGDYERYRVDVTTTAGRPVISMLVPGPLSAELPIAITTAALVPGDYEITLAGLPPDGQSQPIDYYYCTLK